MKEKYLPTLLFILSLSLALAGALVCPPTAVGADPPDHIEITLQTPSHRLVPGRNGAEQVQIEGFDRFGLPGNPELPAKLYNIALPPDVNGASLAVELIEVQTIDLPGSHDIAPAPPLVTWIDGQQVFDWGENADSIVDGKNIKVYQNDAYFPPSQVTLLGPSQMRKWRFARLLFNPIQYNPVTGRLRLTTEVELRLTFGRSPVDELQIQTELNDTVMDTRAAQIFYNYDQAKDWYQPDEALREEGADADYVIITTNAIATASSKLDDFVTHREAKGFEVEVITEDHYGGLVGQPPNGTAEKIRQWLINNYLTRHIEYVLLIGNPDPDDPENEVDDIGDVPMKMCWPRDYATSDRESPTDYFYADLTGNWDLDGDIYFGEDGDDGGPGGVDLANEVYVGRIPVYKSLPEWETTLDNILQKIIDYDNAANQTWRQAALLPMSFSDSGTDGAYLAEHMKGDYLIDNGFTSYTLYQQGPACSDSILDSDEPLLDRAVRNRWQNNKYGLVIWWAHGTHGSALLGYGGCSSGILLSSSDSNSLDDRHPAFVFHASCANGFPEYNSNLGYALLKKGAISTVSSSRMSWYRPGIWSPGLTADNANIGYGFMKRIVNGKRVGKALYDEKSAIAFSFPAGGGTWLNLMDFNLYGDPATRLQSDYVCYLPVILKR